MNDAASDPESMALTYEEAKQVLRLTPEGLRRLADLDEAINELKSARRSLLANRLESIKDAFAASRNGRAGGEQSNSDERAKSEAGDSRLAENGDPPSQDSAPSDVHAEVPAQAPSIRVSARAGREGHLGRPPAQPLGRAGQSLSSDSELNALRSEIAELRREIADLKRFGSAGIDSELMQVQRRLSYLEAEVESRES